MYLPAQALIHWGPPTSESRDFSRPLGEGEGAQGSCSVVLVNTFLGSHFRHSPHTSPVLMPCYTPPHLRSIPYSVACTMSSLSWV